MMSTPFFSTIDTTKWQLCVNYSGSQPRSVFETAGGSLSGGGPPSGGCLYLNIKKYPVGKVMQELSQRGLEGLIRKHDGHLFPCLCHLMSPFC